MILLAAIFGQPAATYYGTTFSTTELLFQAPSLGVGFRAVPFRLHDDIAGLLVGQVRVLLVKVLDLVGLVARYPATVWPAGFRLVICHGVLLLAGEAI